MLNENYPSKARDGGCDVLDQEMALSGHEMVHGLLVLVHGNPETSIHVS
jgi:hypothetical protein